MFNHLLLARPADLRSKPIAREMSAWNDSLQETQILAGEQVVILNEERNWIFIKLLNQEIFKDKQCQPYQGWTLKNSLVLGNNRPNWVLTKKEVDLFSCKDQVSSKLMSLPYGTQVLGEIEGEWLKVISGKKAYFISKENIESIDRFYDAEKLISEAESLINVPYVWGGLSTLKDQGLDCSGLIHILFRSFGKTLPRNAHDQFLSCQKKKKRELALGDLIFSSEKGISGRIDHVMLYCGHNKIIEAVKGERKVRAIGLKEKFNDLLEEDLEVQSLSNGQAIFYGVFKDKSA